MIDMPRSKTTSSKSQKPMFFLRSPLLVAFLLAVVVAITSGVLYLRSSRELASAQQSLQASKTQIQTLVGQVANHYSASTSTNQTSTQPAEKLDPFAEISESTKNSLLRDFSFLPTQYQSLKQLSPSLVIAIIGSSDEPTRDWFNHESVWVLNTDTAESRRLTKELSVGDGNWLWLREWSGGVVIDRQTSPGEAVGDTHSLFVDRMGTILAEAEVGTFERDRATADVRLSGKTFALSYIQKTPCEQPESLQNWMVPTTTITGISVNGLVSRFPHEITMECDLGYGDSVGSPIFPSPSFDGKGIVFHFPGYDVSLNTKGSLTFTQKTAYFIPCTYSSSGAPPLILEDKTGWHKIRADLYTDPIFNTLEKKGYCFEVTEYDSSRLQFLVRMADQKTLNTPLNGVSPVASFEYDIKKNIFQNFFLLPPTDGLISTNPVEECATNWSRDIDRLKAGDREVVAPFETCVHTLEYPFKSFPIPGVKGAYMGFVGNGSSTDAGLEAPWCAVDGQQQGCILYRVEQGKPTVLAMTGDPNTPFSLKQPIQAKDRNSMVVRRFPYEICWFSDYEVYDFAKNTSTASLVEFTGSDVCSAEPSLRFWVTKTRSVNLVLRSVSQSEAFPKMNLIFNGKTIATLPARMGGGWAADQNFFPSEGELAAYAQQSDRTKFYFSLQGKRYVIDLAGSVPRLIGR